MSLKLLYSGSKIPNGSSEALSSLGGYPSNIEIQNNLIGNLFGDLSRYIIGLNRDEVRAIVVKNEGDSTLTGVKVWVEYPDDGESEPTQTNDCTLQVAVSALTVDDCGDTKFAQSVSNPFASPYGIIFVDAETEANALSLPDIPSQGMVGLWIKRRLKSSTLQPLSEENLLAILDGSLVLPTQEDIQLIFSWD